MSQISTPLLSLITRFYLPAERLARMQLLQKKQASIIVQFVFEDLYEEALFYEGPHLRPLIIKKIKAACYQANQIHQHSHGTPFYHPNRFN